MVREHSLTYYFTHNWWANRFMLFLRTLTQSETQTASSKTSTLFTKSIFFNNMHYSQTMRCSILTGYFSNMPHTGTILEPYYYSFMIIENTVGISIVMFIYIRNVKLETVPAPVCVLQLWVAPYYNICASIAKMYQSKQKQIH